MRQVTHNWQHLEFLSYNCSKSFSNLAMWCSLFYIVVEISTEQTNKHKIMWKSITVLCLKITKCQHLTCVFYVCSWETFANTDHLDQSSSHGAEASPVVIWERGGIHPGPMTEPHVLYSHTHLQEISICLSHLPGEWQEADFPRENPRRHRKNMQHPHRPELTSVTVELECGHRSIW